ncbi:hypothetical protein EDB84DRAFT_443721 [Lactarius hengduanensis]|nr:hypothetical protein EDB84DRAFT_443721 [Lactarius hengduanensis]
MAVWDQRLDGFFVQSSSQLVLCLYAKRLSQSDLLIGTHQITVPVKSETNISFVLSHGHGQAGQPTEPVTLYLSIAVLANRASPTDSPKIPTEGDEPPAPLLPLSDHLLVQSSAPVPQDPAETSLVKKARVDLDRADEVNESINRSNTWEGAVRKIKWVMDTLSPVAELHPIAQMAYRVLSVIPEVNSQDSTNVTTISEPYSRVCTTRLISQSTKTL